MSVSHSDGKTEPTTECRRSPFTVELTHHAEKHGTSIRQQLGVGPHRSPRWGFDPTHGSRVSRDIDVFLALRWCVRPAWSPMASVTAAA